MLTINPLKRRDWLTLLFILVIAAVMRLGEPGVLEYGHDEAMLSLLAQDMAAARTFPLTGIPSSVGIPNPPISVYIMALPYLISDSPQVAILFVAALNVIGVGLLWLIAARYVGRNSALIAGLAYALNPWAILYSRKIWAQDFHTPFLLLALLLGLYGFGEGKRWAQVFCLPVLLFALQIHFAAWTLLPVFLWLLWLGRKQLDWRATTFSVLLGIITLIPFGIGLTQTLEQDPNRLSNAVNRSNSTLTISGDALIYHARFVTGLGLETTPETVASEQAAELLTGLPVPSILWMVFWVTALIGLIGLIRQRHLFAIITGLWIGIPLLIFTPTWTPIYPHYFIPAIPMLFLLVGAGAAYTAHILPGKAAVRLVIPALIGMILLTQGLWRRGLLRYLDTTYTPGGFNAPMHHLMDVRDALANSDDVIVLSDGYFVEYDQEAAIWPSMLWRMAECVRTLKGDGIAVLPAEPFTVVTAPNAPDNPLGGLYERPDDNIFPLRPGEGEYRVAFFEAAPEWAGEPLTSITPARFGAGIILTGYSLSDSQLTLEWRLPGPVQANYHYFGHFLNAAGEKIGQGDSFLWPGRHWCAGDRLITWTVAAPQPETSILRVGLYTLDGEAFINAPLLDEAGNSIGTWVDIPLTES